MEGSTMPYANRCEASAEIVASLEKAVRDHVCTAWSAACKDWHASAFYADEWAPRAHGGVHPVFDLASLTKPLFVPALAGALGLGADWWNAPRPELGGLAASDLRDHASGARAWFWMGRGAFASKAGETVAKAHFEGRTREETRAHATRLLRGICLSHLASPAVARGETLYSDVNYFLLARFLEDARDRAGSGADAPPGDGAAFWRAALGSLNEAQGTEFRHASLPASAKGRGGSGGAGRVIPYFPYVSILSDAATGEESGFVTFGPAHDTNANLLADALGGVVSGHAGLFGTVADVDSSLPGIAARQEAFVRGRAPRARFQGGLDTPSGPTSTAGIRNFPTARPGSIVGHLGFTGTSFWFERGEGSGSGALARRHVLLTNRTASRTAFGLGVPRLLVFTSPGGDWIWGGVSNGAGFVETTEEDWRATALEHAGARILLWDQAAIRPPPDVAALRRGFGLLAWDA